ANPIVSATNETDIAKLLIVFSKYIFTGSILPTFNVNVEYQTIDVGEDVFGEYDEKFSDIGFVRSAYDRVGGMRW
ncbi:MAG: hypothetical protein AAGK23_13690, partial [Pseudomonadota bacterium]